MRSKAIDARSSAFKLPRSRQPPTSATFDLSNSIRLISQKMRRTLGIAVFSGMLGVTLFGIPLTPVFYYVVVRLFGQKAPHSQESDLRSGERTKVTGKALPPSVELTAAQ